MRTEMRSTATRLAAAGPQVLFGVLIVLIAIGMAAAILYFRKDRPNEFDRESDDLATESTGYGV